MGRGTTRAVLAALVLLSTAACGGGDTGAGGVFDQGDASSDGGGAGATEQIDMCSLLEESEIEAQFGERGAVAEGTPGLGCSWDVGSPFDAGTGSLHLQDLPLTGLPVEEALASYRDLAQDPVDIEGLGDDAFFEYELDDAAGLRQSTTRLTFTTGDLLLKLEANFFGRDVDAQEEQERYVSPRPRAAPRPGRRPGER